MSDTLLTFQKFNDAELAATIAAHLKELGISSLIVKEAPVFDISFAHNEFEPTVHLKLLPADFTRAQAALETYYEQQLGDVDPDYYLFSFTNPELMEILKHPDEWGQLDHALAKKLLADRGQAVTPDQEDNFQRERLKDLKKPDATPYHWIIGGYLLAIFFGVFGIIVGYIFAYIKKTLPNGEQVYAYSVPVRNRGKRILVLSLIVLILWLANLLKM